MTPKVRFIASVPLELGRAILGALARMVARKPREKNAWNSAEGSSARKRTSAAA